MPKFEMPDQPHIDAAAKNAKENVDVGDSSRFLNQTDIVELLQTKHEGEIIGRGSECFVVPIEGQDKKVAAYTYERIPPNRAKEIFYMQRLFSTLFPHNFPHFYASFGTSPKDKNRLVGTIREKVRGKAKTSLGYKFEGPESKLTALERVRALLKKGPPIRHPFKKVEEACKKMGFRPPVDKAYVNFILGSDGGEYYVDTPMFTPHNMDIERIRDYMTKHNYIEDDIHIAEQSIKRLKELEKEFEAAAETAM